LPTFIAILKFPWVLPGPLNALSPDPEPPGVVEVVVEPAVVEDATLATPGDPPPPPQPAARKASAPAETVEVMTNGRRQRIELSSSSK
jgi:hypothetical protein